MKFVPSQLAAFLQHRATRRNLRVLRRYFLALGVLILLYSVLFHAICWGRASATRG